MHSALRTTRQVAKFALVLGVAGYLLPGTTLFFVACGLLDARRNGWQLVTFERYFLVNGAATWLLSPVNLFLDLLSLPHVNKGVYALDDLPEAAQREIARVIALTRDRHVVDQLAPKLHDDPRSMIFFKWHGRNITTSIAMPEFHERYEHVRTIGISVIAPHSGTSEHFGPFRHTLRVLYNLTPTDRGDVYIRVNAHRHEWRHDPLFIFDDTLLHQSINGSDVRRYCLFLDVMRPSPWPGLLRVVVAPFQAVVGRINAVFYRRWRFVK